MEPAGMIPLITLRIHLGLNLLTSLQGYLQPLHSGENPVLAKNRIRGSVCTSNEGRFFTILVNDILDNFKSLLVCFHILSLLLGHVVYGIFRSPDIDLLFDRLSEKNSNLD